MVAVIAYHDGPGVEMMGSQPNRGCTNQAVGDVPWMPDCTDGSQTGLIRKV